MKVIGCVIWYDEAPSWLAECVASLARAGCSHVVAVDGAYEFFPGGRAWSGCEQHEAILRTAHGAGMGCTIHAPQHTWIGNEVEKRSFLFAAAEPVAEPEIDWYFVMDADQVVTAAPGLVQRLRDTDRDAAEVTFWERHDPHVYAQTAEIARATEWDRESQWPVRCLFRAVRGLRVRDNHYTYALPDGRLLWGDARDDRLEPAENLTEVRVEHRNRLRDVARQRAAREFYRLRDEIGIEIERGERV